MDKYKQPDFYHFSDDSIWLTTQVQLIECGNKRDGDVHCLDLCAGCGVVGIEFANIYPISSLSFIEKQNTFIPLLKENCNKLKREIDVEVASVDLLEYESERKIDILLCNPPYFNEGDGRRANSKEKNACRFLEGISYVDILKFCYKFLNSSKGIGYILYRSDLPYFDTAINEMKSYLSYRSIKRTTSLSLAVIKHL
jgi:tRNA1Val (adenine37-N6)-methyltransferase